MARSQQTIYSSLLNSYVVACANIGITINPARLGTAAQWAAWAASGTAFASQYNLQGLFMWLVAGVCTGFEQILDLFTADAEATALAAPPQTSPWWQSVMFLFQFNATTPQVLQYNTSTQVWFYPGGVNPNYQVVFNCTVVPGAFGTTSIKIGANNAGVPGDMDTYAGAGALAAAKTYVNLLSVPGITMNVISGNPDKIYIKAIVTYNGQYAALIPIANGTVVKAIQNFLASIPANGIAGTNSSVGLLKLTDLIAAARAVPGVTDFELIDVNGRPDMTTFVPGVYNLVSGNDWLQNEYNSGLQGVGFMATENFSGYDINDPIHGLQYVAQ